MTQLVVSAMDEAGRPPVVFPQQVHDGGDEQHADDGGVDKQCKNHAESDVLHHHNVGKTESACHHNHDESRSRNNASGVRSADGDGFICIGTVRTTASLHHAGD